MNKTKSILKRGLSLLLTLMMLLSLVTVGIVSSSAAEVELAETGATVTSDGTARLYFNMSAVSWWTAGTNGNGNFAYFFNSSSNKWSAHAVQYSGSTYYVVIPSGSWTTVILTRNNTSTSPTWDNKWNQTGNITLSSTSNYISKFSEGSTSATWGTAVKPSSTAKLTASASTVAPNTAVTLTPSLSSNASINTIKSTTYSVGSGATISGNTFTATQPGTYTVTATVTYHPNGYSSLTSTATATTTITVEASEVTATFKDYNGTVLDTDTVESGSTPTYGGVTPTREGYTFTGWSPAIGAITADTTYTAQYKINNYTVSVSGNPAAGGTTTSTASSVDHGKSVTLTAAPNTANNYSFTGWTITGTYSNTVDTGAASITLYPTSNITAVANYTQAETYTVKASAGTGGSATPANSSIIEGNAVTLQATADTGYSFDKWTITGSYTVVTGSTSTATFVIKPTSNITATASFKGNTSSIAFAANTGGAVTNSAASNVTYPGTKSSTATPNAGYTFSGWTITGGTAGEDYVLVDCVETSSTLKIQPLKAGKTITATANFTINKYTVTFKGMDGETISTQQVEHGKSATAPTAPQVTGYTFTGWDRALTNITSDTTITAEYSANTYTVSASAATTGGTAQANKTSVTYPGEVTLTATADADYTFAGWNINGDYEVVSGSTNSATFIIKPESNIVAQASFVEGQYLTVHSYSDNGLDELTVKENNGSTTKTVLNKVEQPTDTTFNGVSWDTSAQMELTNGYSNSVTATLSGTGKGNPLDSSTWYDASTGTFLVAEGYRTIVCTNNNGWSNMYAHIWGSSDYATWPGTKMTKAYTNSQNQDVYVIVFPDTYYNIIFHNNSGAQSPDTNISGITAQGYWLDGTTPTKWDISTHTASASTSAIELSDVLYNSDGSWAGETEVWITESGTVTLRRDILDLVSSMTTTYNGGVNEADYTASSWADFVDAYEDAYAKSGASTSTQAQLDAAAVALQDAYDALEMQAYYTVNVSQNFAGTVKVGSTTISTKTGTANVAQGSTVTVTVTAPTNYYIKSVSGLVSASNVTPSYSQTVTVSADSTITVEYAENPDVTVTHSGATGTAKVDGKDASSAVKVSYGAKPSISVDAPDMYYIASITVGGKAFYTNNGDETVGTYTGSLTTAVTADTTVVVTYAPCTTYDITVTYGQTAGSVYYNGELVANGEVITVLSGANVTLTATPSDGYAISYWVVDSVESGREPQYTFTNVTKDHTVTVEWVEIQQISVTVNASPYPAGVAKATSGSLTATSTGTKTITIDQYSTVNLTATLSDGCYQFVNWSIEGSYYFNSGTLFDESLSITASGGNLKITANYELVNRKIYLDNAAGWSQPYIHYWGGSEGSSWPGVKMTKDNVSGYWVAYIPLDTTDIQFNDGTNQNQKEFKGIDAKNLYNNSSMTTNTYVEDGYYLQGTWNGKTYSGYDLQKFYANGDGTYSIDITVNSTTDGYIYVNPTDENSHFWNAATNGATGNPQNLTATGAYQSNPKQVKIEIDTTDFKKSYNVTMTFNPTTGQFSWTKTENVPTITIIGTDGQGKTQADSAMVSGNGRVGNTYFGDESVIKISEHTYHQAANVIAGNPITFYTQVNQNGAGGYDYYVAGWVVNGTEFVSATSLGNGLYSGSYVFTENSDIIPVYFHTPAWLEAEGINTVTVYAVTDTSITNWQDYMTAYTWFKVGSVNQHEQFGAWPGQVMIPVAGLDGVYFTYVETTDINGNDISGITFNNYPNGDSIDVTVHDRANLQAYDYYEFMALLGDNMENITFVLKNTNTSYNKNNVATNTNETLSSFQFVPYVDYNGSYIDIFGNDISDTYDSLNDSKALYVIQAGDQDLTGQGHAVLDGQWYVKCYLYDATGKYLGECYSYELHDKDSAIWSTTLSGYENQKAFISYEALSGIRYDGEWYGDTDVTVTVNLAVQVALTTDGGKNYTVDTEGNINEADYGTGYINATLQNIDVTRGATVTLSATPKAGYKFVGWYTAEGVLFDTNTTTTVTAAIATTYTAVFEKLEEGMFSVNHYIYQGVGTADYVPYPNKGNATLYVGIQNVTQGTYTTVSVQNSAYIQATEGDKLIITIATDAIGADKFYAWYTDSTDKYGKSTYEEVGVDSVDNLACVPGNEYYNNGSVIGRNDKVYYQFEHIVSDDLFTINLYSDLIPVTVDKLLIYKYENRYGETRSYYVPYILNAQEIEGFAGNNFEPMMPAYISSPDNEWVNTILANAPYVEDFYKDTTWDIVEFDELTLVLWATQPETLYTVTSQIGESVVVSQVPFNTVLGLDAGDYGMSSNGMWYNDVDGDGRYTAGTDIILTYGPQYGYRVTKNMSINYMEVESFDFNITVDEPVYGREQTTDTSGANKTDIIIVDYFINILTPFFYGQNPEFTPWYNGVQITDNWNGQHVTIESLEKAGYTIDYGVIMEQVGSFDVANGAFEAALKSAQGVGYGTATDTSKLISIVDNNKSGMVDGKYYTILDATSHSITNKNRIQFIIEMNNTDKNQRKFYNVYSYVTVTTPAGVTTTYISNVQTLNIHTAGTSDAVVSDGL